MALRNFFCGRAATVAVVLGGGGVWWWAVLRLVLQPGEAGVVEGTVVAGGWGLSLLPVHAVSAAAAGVDPKRWRRVMRRRDPGPGEGLGQGVGPS
ncbi:hypothetical protein [Streptomyces hypolithicus]